MTVGELIKSLSRYDEDKDVRYYESDFDFNVEYEKAVSKVSLNEEGTVVLNLTTVDTFNISAID